MKGLSPKVVLSVVILIALTLFVSLAKEMNRRIQIQHQVKALQNEVQGMQRSIVEMENLNHYFQTDAYQERLAREKLNYQAPGEKVVLIPENSTTTTTADQTATADTPNYSIPERWWRRFFVPEKDTSSS